jgi:IS30 family transposase
MGKGQKQQYTLQEDMALRKGYRLGLSNAQIAQELGRSERSVSRRITRLNLRTKGLDAQRRTAASVRAWEGVPKAERKARMAAVASKIEATVPPEHADFYKSLRAQKYTKDEALGFIKDLDMKAKQGVRHGRRT